MIWRKFSIACLLVVVICLANCSRGTDPQKPRETPLTSIQVSAQAFFKLTAAEQQTMLSSAVAQRLQLFDNVQYSTSFKAYNIKGGSAFPYGGPIPPPTPEQNLVLDTRLSQRWEGSYKTETTRKNLKRPDISIFTVNAYDAICGEFRGTNIVHDGQKNRTHAAILLEKDIIDKEDRLSYWGSGKTEPRGVYFLTDALLALEKWKNASLDSQQSGVLLTAGNVGEIQTITLTFESVVPRQVNVDGTITVEFDPQRQFLPIAFRVERNLRTSKNRKLLWFEAMLVVDAAQEDGVWFPTRFQLLQANEPLTASNTSPLYDIRVESIEFGSVSPDEVELIFPAGVRVVDRIREVHYIADGKGAAQGKVRSLNYPDVSAVAEAIGFNGFWLLLLNLGVVLLIFVVFFVRRRTRLNAKKGNS